MHNWTAARLCVKKLDHFKGKISKIIHIILPKKVRFVCGTVIPEPTRSKSPNPTPDPTGFGSTTLVLVIVTKSFAFLFYTFQNSFACSDPPSQITHQGSSQERWEAPSVVEQIQYFEEQIQQLQEQRHSLVGQSHEDRQQTQVPR
jgi:hypothetical protein